MPYILAIDTAMDPGSIALADGATLIEEVALQTNERYGDVLFGEIERLLAGHGEGPGFSIVPAHDGRGSNAIVMTPPNAVTLSFGNDSFLPHLDSARSAGLTPRVLRLPGIGLDIDNPEDLALFMRRPSSTRSWAFLAASGLVQGIVRPPESLPELLRS